MPDLEPERLDVRAATGQAGAPGPGIHSVLVVDDEPLARDRIRVFLRHVHSIRLAGECGDGIDAVETIERERPDIVFLDMQLPRLDGLGVMARIATSIDRPEFIVATAHHTFAVEAFEAGAADYLLKPFAHDRFLTALHRAMDRVAARRATILSTRIEALLDEGAPAKPEVTRMAFKHSGRIVVLRSDEIVRVEAADNYAIVHRQEGGRILLRETLSALEAQLRGCGFLRVNRSHLVRADQIRELRPSSHGAHIVLLVDGTRLPLRRGFRDAVEAAIARGI